LQFSDDEEEEQENLHANQSKFSSLCVKKFIFLAIIPFFNFLLWYLLASNFSSNNKCQNKKSPQNPYKSHFSSSPPLFPPRNSSTLGSLPRIRPVLTRGLIDYKADYLINIRYPEWSLLLQQKRFPPIKYDDNKMIKKKKKTN
jgi:hypothetical protein